MRTFGRALLALCTLGMTGAVEDPLLRGSVDCSIYTTSSNNCANGCGSCANPGGRPGVKCQSGGIGYYCAAEGTGATFACMDWSFASSAMRAAEDAFAARVGERVYLGVGTYGSTDDPQRGLGNCYRLTVEGVDRDIIAQSVNTGSDVAGNQFDLQMGAGGAGAFDVCAGNAASVFPGTTAPWGCIYGGIDNATACYALPEYPVLNPGAMQAAGDSLVELCVASFRANVRTSGEGRPAGPCKYNPTLLDVARVRCPEELVNLTWFQRSDEPAGYGFVSRLRSPGFPNTANRCSTDIPGKDAAYCLTRMMDCRKPSGAFVDNVQKSRMVTGRRVVQTCTADGYTRIDVQCGCNDCYC